MLLDHGRETIGTSALDAVPDVILRMPGDSFAPLLLSLTLAIAFVGMLMHSWWLFGIAVFCSAVASIAWLWPEAKLGQTMGIVRAHG
jgi:cytochrome c oxidase subunit 1/cytochrome c oxidase subunit I+III